MTEAVGGDDEVRPGAPAPELVDLLAARSVPAIVLTGPSTRLGPSGPDEVRPTADVDLLVPSGRFRRAGRALRDDGYSRVDRGGHSDVWRRGDAVVGLHLTLPFATAAPRQVFAALWSHTTPIVVAGRSVPALDEAAHVVHLAVHAALDGFEPGCRSSREWARGRASLSEDQAVAAAAVADALGVWEVWALARVALSSPSGAGSMDLAAGLPIRTPQPGRRGMEAFARSPIPARVRGRELGAAVRLALADRAGGGAAWSRREGGTHGDVGRTDSG